MRVLVVRVGRLGDMVMITPALDALFEKYPDAELTLVTSPEGRRVLAGFHPRLRDLWVHRRKGALQIVERASLRRRIREAGFDRIYLFESRPSYAALVRGAASSIESLADLPPGSPVMHFAERCLQLVDPSGPFRPVRLPVTDGARARAAALFREAGIPEGTHVVGFHPSFFERGRLFGDATVQRNKSWPPASWGSLAKQLAERARAHDMPIRIVMDLTPGDRALGEEIAAASEGAIQLLVPTLDFERYKATLASMHLFVAPDTGPMHLAAAVGTPVVALFSGKDPADCGPYVDPSRRVVLRAEDSPRGRDLGLAALEPERVVAACEQMLKL